MLFWRGLFAGLFLGAMVAVQERGRFRAGISQHRRDRLAGGTVPQCWSLMAAICLWGFVASAAMIYASALATG
jgi:hypothetical protein